MVKPTPTPRAPRLKSAGLAVVLACAIAKPAEGLYLKTYYDPVGILTACYGTTGPEIRKGAVYSLGQCEHFLQADMLAAVNQVEKCAPGLPVPVRAAFADAVYNLGPKIACDTKSSTAARYLARYAAGTYTDPTIKQTILTAACNQLPRWDKARVMGVMTVLPGLTKRRKAEQALCLQGVAA